MIFIIENLTARAWLFSVLPEVRRALSLKGNVQCFVIDCQRMGWWLARLSAYFFRFKIEPFQFRLIDIKDESGLLVRYRLPLQDAFEMQKDILSSNECQNFLSMLSQPTRFSHFLTKAYSFVAIGKPLSHGQAMFLINVVAWKIRQAGWAEIPVTLFLELRPWFGLLREYAKRFHVSLEPTPAAFRFTSFIRQNGVNWVPGWFAIFMKVVLHRKKDFWNRKYRSSFFKWLFFVRKSNMIQNSTNQILSPKIGIDFQGHLNLDFPERHSDLFVWQQSKIPAEDFKVCFGMGYYPLEQSMVDEIVQHKMSAVAIRPDATRTFSVPVYNIEAPISSSLPAGPLTNVSLESKEIMAKWKEYGRAKTNWIQFFHSSGIKIFLSWMKYTDFHYAITDALREVGGIFCFYQRAYDAAGMPEMASSADVVYGFSSSGTQIEKTSGSSISYYVVTGYLGDHRFKLLKEPAQLLRERLLRNGAKRVLSYFDENSMNDARWHTGHDVQREGYAFFLEKFFKDSTMGLILKPKVPKTLRRRLGPVAELLKTAEATGRCVVLEGGGLHGATPPALAAMASDLAIHSCLGAATAGLEAALAGVRTVLIDREGWPKNPLYRLGRGQVAFESWEHFWSVYEELEGSRNGLSKIGDWTPSISEFDPFHDGRAAERMGMHLQWMFNALKAGKNREAALEESAERYAEVWGSDKIFQIENRTIKSYLHRDLQPSSTLA